MKAVRRLEHIMFLLAKNPHGSGVQSVKSVIQFNVWQRIPLSVQVARVKQKRASVQNNQGNHTNHRNHKP